MWLGPPSGQAKLAETASGIMTCISPRHAAPLGTIEAEHYSLGVKHDGDAVPLAAYRVSQSTNN